MKIYKQETNKSCSIACLRSIFNFFGNDFSEEDIWKVHKPFDSKTGILNSVIGLGITALKFGFDVTYVGYNPLITNNNVSENLEESLKKKSKKCSDYDKFCLNETLKFLKLGGRLKIDRLNIEKLKKILDKNKFVFVQIRPAFVKKKSNSASRHKVILTGYTKRGFNVLNPANAKKEFIDFDTFLLAFYAAIPELLIIKK